MKRMLTIFLCVAMLLSLTACGGRRKLRRMEKQLQKGLEEAVEVYQEELSLDEEDLESADEADEDKLKEANNIKWDVDDYGTLTVSGKGALPSDYAPWNDQADYIARIVFEEGITAVNKSNYRELDNVTSLSLPSTLEQLYIIERDYKKIEIADLAAWCQVDVELETKINGGISCFVGSETELLVDGEPLEKLEIPEGVESINDYVFFGFVNHVSEIIIPDSVTSIGTFAFGCNDDAEIEKVVIGDGVTKISCAAFVSRWGDLVINDLYWGSAPEILFGYDSYWTMGGIVDDVKNFHVSDLTSWCQSESEFDLSVLAPDFLYVNDELIENLVIPDGIDLLRTNKFCGLNLQCVFIPQSMKSIQSTALMDNPITDIFFAGSEDEWNMITVIGDDMDEILENAVFHFNYSLSDMEAYAEKRANTSIPLDAFIFDGHSYYYYDECESWEEAKEFCESLDGHLATLTSEKENAAVYQWMTEHDLDNAYFGLSDAAEEGTFAWVNGEPVVYTNWHEDEPNGGEDENYVCFYYSFEDETWNDASFGNGGRGFLCEWDTVWDK